MTRRRERVTSSDYILSLRFERNVPLIDVTESKPARPEEPCVGEKRDHFDKGSR